MNVYIDNLICPINKTDQKGLRKAFRFLGHNVTFASEMLNPGNRIRFIVNEADIYFRKDSPNVRKADIPMDMLQSLEIEIYDERRLLSALITKLEVTEDETTDSSEAGGNTDGGATDPSGSAVSSDSRK